MNYLYSELPVAELYLSIIEKAIYHGDIAFQKLYQLAVAVHSELLRGISAGKSHLLYFYSCFNSLLKCEYIIAGNYLGKKRMKAYAFKVFRIGELEYLTACDSLGQFRGILLEKIGYFYLHLKTPVHKIENEYVHTRTYCNSASLKLFNLRKKLGNDLLLPYLALSAVLAENDSAAVAACNSHIGFAGFSRTVDDTAHDSHSNVLFHVLDCFLNHFRSLNKVDTGPSAGGT